MPALVLRYPTSHVPRPLMPRPPCHALACVVFPHPVSPATMTTWCDSIARTTSFRKPHAGRRCLQMHGKSETRGARCRCSSTLWAHAIIALYTSTLTNHAIQKVKSWNLTANHFSTPMLLCPSPLLPHLTLLAPWRLPPAPQALLKPHRRVLGLVPHPVAPAGFVVAPGRLCSKRGPVHVSQPIHATQQKLQAQQQSHITSGDVSTTTIST